MRRLNGSRVVGIIIASVLLIMSMSGCDLYSKAEEAFRENTSQGRVNHIWDNKAETFDDSNLQTELSGTPFFAYEKQIEFSNSEPIMYNNLWYVPLRETAEALGFTVNWTDEGLGKTISVSSDRITKALTGAFGEEKEYNLLRENTQYVALKFFVDELGCEMKTQSGENGGVYLSFDWSITNDELAYFSSASYLEPYCSPSKFSQGDSIGYKNWKFERVEYDSDTNFSCSIFKKDKSIVFAFRGTIPPYGYQSNVELDWGNTLRYMLLDDGKGSHGPKQYLSLQSFFYQLERGTVNEAKYFSDTYNDYLDYDIYFTGHSLGGWLAQMAYDATIGLNIAPEKVKRVITFNALGINQEFISDINNYNDKIVTNYYAGDDIARWACEGRSMSYAGASEKLTEQTGDILSFGECLSWLVGLSSEETRVLIDVSYKSNGKDDNAIVLLLIDIVRSNSHGSWFDGIYTLTIREKYLTTMSRLMKGHEMKQFLSIDIPD